MRIEAIARICHEANRAFQLELGETVSPPWDQVSDEMADSVHQGVHAALAGKSPEALHRLWLISKEAAGWVHGEVKDEESKTHPNMIPYDELPEEQQAKDHLFHAIVKALA